MSELSPSRKLIPAARARQLDECLALFSLIQILKGCCLIYLQAPNSPSASVLRRSIRLRSEIFASR